jgi:4-diphosphocytidyl-2-C-methyl-D-erythritol kinase
MVVFPNGKINLGLNILAKREDGFHDLATVFYPIPLKDSLEVIENANAYAPIEFTNSGILAEADEENNSCVKAYRLLKKDFPQLPAVNIHLYKAIPMGAGLGGGSADASFLLKLLDERFQLGLSSEKLSEYALQLGSDCPFFLLNKACLAKSRGEIIREIALDLSNYKLLLIHPGIHVNTGWAFAQLNGKFTNSFVEKNIELPVAQWKHILFNDFEKPVFEKYPVIKNIKDNLYQQGALYASMSGSGSTVYGIFEKNAVVKTDLSEKYFSAAITL